MEPDDSLILIETYVFIFVNPLSGDQRGKELTDLSIQHFRLKENKSVQVQIYNIIKEKSKLEGINYLKLLFNNRKQHNSNYKLQVWSGGGDGTIIGIVKDLLKYDIDLDQLIFSCLPFGTGNDFAQALGWGKTIEQKDLINNNLENLSQLIYERINGDSSNQVKLDLWNTKIKVTEDGYIQKVVKQGKESEKMKSFERSFAVYFALGVQGFVGSGFEKKRSESRFVNFFIYFFESLKWVAFRKFPSITNILECIEFNNNKVLVCQDNDDNIPILKGDIIELIIQNIPRVWSMDIDLWKNAEDNQQHNNNQDKQFLINRNGPIDNNNWTKQSSNDNKIEIMGIKSMSHYIKLVSNITKDTVKRIGQFENNLKLKFHDPSNPKMPNRNAFRRFFRKDVYSNDEKDWLTYCMIDGEFFKVFKPVEIEFEPFIKLNIIGSTYEKSRVVKDELAKN